MVLWHSERSKIVYNRLLGPVLACLGPVLGCLGLSWACLGLSWPVLGLSWACLGPALACLGPVLTCLVARISAGNPSHNSLQLSIHPLQRGGTCAAHPPPPEGMPSVPDSYSSAPLLPASKACVKGLASRSSHMGLPPSFFSFPRARTYRRTSSAICS